MLEQTPFVSYAPDHEDVVLWRALGSVRDGRYADVRGDGGRTTRALHERGWAGLVRGAARPGDVEVTEPSAVPNGPLHVLVWDRDLDTEALADVVGRTRPWVVVTPDDPAADAALVAHGYRAALDTGASRVHVSEAHAELAPTLGRPASSQDEFVDADLLALRAENEELRGELLRWRGLALRSWSSWEPRQAAEWTIHDERERDSLREEIRKMQETLSWRVTRPLRALRRVNAR